ncbi:MAG: 3-demethylubiquinone-9 3-O-methyltransferase [Gemmatimonadetes bacterium]|nr:MAG: 3-demethylubiquinone-9 3-O-methyltransferase [Gemmatimonadota bacterium]PYP63445.1 MAG: 3-demethylubiquinone-9 3-O-methyltransferase [Gemmatimonadota bacterium]
MSDTLPRVEGLAEPAKYERLVEHSPDVWWAATGPFVGLHQLNTARVDYFRGVFGGFRGKRALDVGCGGGILAEALAREGAIVTGLDPSEKSLAVARRHAAEGGLRIEYRVGAAEQLATWNMQPPFDLVFAVDVLEHVDDLGRTLEGIATALRPGGGLGFLTHNRTPAAFLQLIWREEYVEHTMPEGFHEFRRFLSPAELRVALEAEGLAVQEMKGMVRADESGRRALADDLSVTYLGWARKR